MTMSLMMNKLNYDAKRVAVESQKHRRLLSITEIWRLRVFKGTQKGITAGLHSSRFGAR